MAARDDNFGLAAESDSLENLIHTLKIIILKFLGVNGMDEIQDISFELLSRRLEIAPGAAV